MFDVVYYESMKPWNTSIRAVRRLNFERRQLGDPGQYEQTKAKNCKIGKKSSIKEQTTSVVLIIKHYLQLQQGVQGSSP